MRRILGFVLTVMLFFVGLASPGRALAAESGAYVAGSSRLDSRTLDLTIVSPNVDGGRRTVRLLLPPGWSATADRTWPTLWFLHGGFDDYRSWSDKTDLKDATAGRDAIVVLPDTSWCSAYSDWWNHGSGGAPRWETYLTEDVAQILERGYRASAVRAVAGNSMGGLGALKLTAAHPGFFRGAASFSGNLDPLHSGLGDGGYDKPGLACWADWTRVWGDPEIPAQRAIWVRNDPYEQALRLRGAALFISSGDGTGGLLTDVVERTVDLESKAVVARLRGAGVPVTAHFYAPGTHAWSYWQREMHAALPLLFTSMNL
ncbi:alpha/beta hydrolase family protein [Actinocorallia longicatena]|uniref:Alpha/beta hydrolase family protein n=1 Tax=Actinocorallia longicatena TaxID=111803 RepID=A0ABP6PXH5_9ACTN